MERTHRVRRRVAATVCAAALVLPLTACDALTPGSAAAVPGPRSVPSSTAVPDGDITCVCSSPTPR